MDEQKNNARRRTFRGIVVSTKMNKTLVVLVKRMKKHPKYQKRYIVSRKFQVHDETNTRVVGDTVQFVECRPLSKHKRWRVL